MYNKLFFFIRDFVDSAFINNEIIDHDQLSLEFHQIIKKLDDDYFCNLLICAGYIPDLYQNDSSEETLYSKLIEVIVCEWARRMGFKSNFIKQKASYEDVTIIIKDKILVCDAKSFRLGRSQKAPNVKDFLKLEDIRKWLDRHEEKLGGLVTYPCTHEWSSRSDAYQYCTTKNAPTLMLSYKYLSFLLYYKQNYDTNKLINLWNYNKIFPQPFKKNLPTGNKLVYWNIINQEIVNITGVSRLKLNEFMIRADGLIFNCIEANLKALEETKKNIISNLKEKINQINDINQLREELETYMINAETKTINDLEKRIIKFRLNKYKKDS